MDRRTFLKMCVVQGAAVGGFVGLKFPAEASKEAAQVITETVQRGNEKGCHNCKWTGKDYSKLSYCKCPYGQLGTRPEDSTAVSYYAEWKYEIQKHRRGTHFGQTYYSGWQERDKE